MSYHCAGRGRGVPLLALGFGVLLGCGARAAEAASEGGEPGLEPPESAGGAPGRAGAPGSAAGSGGRAGPEEPVDIGDIPLPDCQPGVLITGAGVAGCRYVYRSQCYEDMLAACACACAGLAATNCIIGGFLNPDEPQSVSCIAR